MHKRIHCRKIRNGDYTKKETKSIIITIKKKKNLNGCTIVQNETREFRRLLQFKRNGTCA